MATEAEIRATVELLVRAVLDRQADAPLGDVALVMVTTTEPVSAEHLARRLAEAAGRYGALRPGEGVWYAPELGFIVNEGTFDGTGVDLSPERQREQDVRDSAVRLAADFGGQADG